MPHRIPTAHRPDQAEADKPQGNTQPAQGPVQRPVPRMPHERDESADRQASDEPSTRRMGGIAHDDMERGLVDTDKGPPLDQTYEKLREDMPDGKKQFRP